MHTPDITRTGDVENDPILAALKSSIAYEVNEILSGNLNGTISALDMLVEAHLFREAHHEI